MDQMKITQENVIQLDFAEEMKNSYRDYAMSVIVAQSSAGCAGWIKARAEAYFVCHERTGTITGQASS